ncbi:hypothetical protein DEI92_11545 [Curtobacterium sp. MCBD17_034]|nr:hypothetical protein DEI86_08945 [Curtobacterium sp. MCBD17_028]PZF58664.1 hypothetical protein DEI92_11545 [Curtobacterium sp. MCBD17_034]PZF64286.1 hypothetical protein DEI81_04715 [Curtobacterium sp. MCBD17_013]PZM34654.1 hypothetical protein DEI90_08115 [Curtobacterium sp. MCBD17_031]
MEDMTDTSEQRLASPALRPATRTSRFHAVQLLPAPATILALGFGAAHGLTLVPLAVVAVAGILATVGSAVLPMSAEPARHPLGGDRRTS